MTRVLLGQLGANGDCLYATTIARQIKADFPGCHLTWAISSLCRRVLVNNPHVDEVWEIPVGEWLDMDRTWLAFEAEAWRRVARGEFDHAFMTQICPSYFANYDGTIRPSQFRNYPRPITVPVETVIVLTQAERERVEEWVWTNNLDAYGQVVLFECSSKSGQSFLTPALAVKVAERVLAAVPDCCFVLSTHEPIETGNERIIHGGKLGLRETAELTKHVDLFVGCGSGVTVAATSAAAKPGLPNIQILDRGTSVFASFKHDAEHFGLPAGHFLETTTANPAQLAEIVRLSLVEGLAVAQVRHGETLPLDFKWYFELIERVLLRQRRYLDAANSVLVTAERYGWRADLSAFGRALILPFLEFDERAVFSNRKAEIERFREAIGQAVAA